MKKLFFAFSIILLSIFHGTLADDGSTLWLHRTKDCNAQIKLQAKNTPTLDIAVQELTDGWNGGPVNLKLAKQKGMKRDGFAISRKEGVITISSPSDIGLLYGAFRLLQMQTMGTASEDFELTDSPFHDIRLLNHWDNLDGNSERGYAGKSIFWHVQGYPETLGQNDVADMRNNPLRNTTYARANASIGINGAVLNNVNASPKMLTTEVLQMTRQYADVLRPYGIKVYLAINFSSPIIVGGLPTADPYDKEVQRWWKQKAKEIYTLIPDFGGFLVKANSEGQPGPGDYGRTHAEGANLLASAIRPYGGIVMWRAFINNPTDPDRAKQARIEFEHLDGQFLDNVIIQVKNGPIDFQPREPFNALFDALKLTAEMPEFQITQEYLGQSNHLAYLGTMWEEFFHEVMPYANYKANQLRARYNAIAGVANTGTDADWTGHPLAQSNWYAFGRMAWNPDLDAETIANEWVSLTFPQLDAKQHQTLVSMLMRSREAVVDYEMPIGLHHQFGDSHYAPGAWDNRPIRRDWLPVFYNQADAEGIGFDRTKATGTDATSQYHPDFGNVMEDLSTCPDKYLLWFHHVPWTHRCQSGRTVWEELCYHYQNGVNEARQLQRQWNSLEGAIDPDIFRDVQIRLMTQTRDAEWWKDGCLLYFQSLHGMPFPDFLDPPVHTLEECKHSRLNVGLYRSPTHDELNKVR
ncbi:MAG: alpha-glucuronidase [Bacteroidales bacterium]|nr:alpha-glucuronidase [Bacteroidales bacterium]